MVSITFEVRGDPVSKGNVRAFANKTTGHVHYANAGGKKLTDWMEAMRSEARHVAPPSLWEGPVRVEMTFIVSRPQYLRKIPKRGPPKPRVWPAKKPDLDKYERGVLDAITGVIIVDDGQVIETAATKLYDYDAPPGVQVLIETKDSPP